MGTGQTRVYDVVSDPQERLFGGVSGGWNTEINMLATGTHEQEFSRMRSSSLRFSRSRGWKKELHVPLGPSVSERFAVKNGFVVAGAGASAGAVQLKVRK